MGHLIESVVMHDELKNRVGIECANCSTCEHLGSEDDGNFPEYAVSWPVCEREGNEQYKYLKPFPFNTEQKCWEPEFWASKFTDGIDGSDESIEKSINNFVSARDALHSN